MAIDNQFGKGIGLAAGFDLGAQKPLDSRVAVNTIAERDAHVTENRAYEGMIVFVDETKLNYQLVNGVWVELLKAEKDRLDALEAMLNGEGEEGQAGGALGALQDNIDAVNERLDEGGDVDLRIAQAESDIDGLQGLVGQPAQAGEGEEEDIPATGLHLALDNAKEELDQAILTEKGRAEGVEAGLQGAIDAINNAENGILAQAKALDKADRDAQLLIDQEQDRRLKALEDANAEGGAVKEAIDKVAQDLAGFEAEQETAHNDLEKAIEDEAARVNKKIADDIATESALRVAEEQRIEKALVDEAAEIRGEMAAQHKDMDDAMKAAVKVVQDEVDQFIDVTYVADKNTQAQKDAAQDKALEDAVAEIEEAMENENKARVAEEARIEGLVTAEAAKAREEEGKLQDAIDAINNEENGILAQAKAHANGLDQAMDLRVDALEAKFEGNESVEAKIAAAQAAAEKHADDAITALVNSAPEAMNTLKELADEIAANEGVYDAYVSQHAKDMAAMKSELQGEIDTDVAAEAALRVAADNALDARLDVIEGEESVEGSIKKALADAKTYANGLTDGVKETVGNIEEAIVTINGELARIESECDAAMAKEVIDRNAAIKVADDRAKEQEAAIRGEFAAADTALHTTISAEIDADVKAEADRAKAEEADIRADFAQADSDLHAAIKGEMAQVVASLNVQIVNNQLQIGLGQGVDFVTLNQFELDMVTDDDIDAIIAGLDAVEGE